MHKLIMGISLLLRQFAMPNPFEQLPNPLLITISGVEIPLEPVLLNWIAEPILYAVTFTVVGLYYHRSVDPAAKGSFLYLVFYCIHIALLALLSKFTFANIAVAMVVIGYVTCHVGLSHLGRRISRYC